MTSQLHWVPANRLQQLSQSASARASESTSAIRQPVHLLGTSESVSAEFEVKSAISEYARAELALEVLRFRKYAVSDLFQQSASLSTSMFASESTLAKVLRFQQVCQWASLRRLALVSTSGAISRSASASLRLLPTSTSLSMASIASQGQSASSKQVLPNTGASTSVASALLGALAAVTEG